MADFAVSISSREVQEGQERGDGNKVGQACLALMVKLNVTTYDYVEDDEEEGERHFGTILDLWKFLSICMTGMRGLDQQVGEGNHD